MLPVTLTAIVQVAAAATSTPVTVITPLPAVAVIVGDAPQFIATTPFGVPTIIPAGNVSVNPSPVCATAPVPVFVTLNVSSVFRLTATACGVVGSALVNLGRGMTTRHGEPEYVAPPRPLMRDESLVNAAGLAAQLEFVWPDTLVIDVTVIVQVAVPEVIAPALKVTILGCVTLTLPEQPAPASITVAPVVSWSPAGRVSTNAIPVCAGLPLAFAIEKTNVDAAFSLSGFVVNDLVITGFAATDRHWSVT